MVDHNKVCLLMSAGLNSIALLEHFSKNAEQVYPIYIQNGFRWEESELYWLKKFLRSVRFTNIEPLQVLSLPLKDTYAAHWSITGVKTPNAKAKPEDVFLPGRNMLLLSKSMLLCSIQNIKDLAIGTDKVYSFEDGKQSYFQKCAELYSKSCGAAIKILTPYLEKGKEEIMYEAKDLGFDYSFSCLNPKGHQHCGACFKCAQRKKAFARSGITDKTVYYRRSNTHTVGA